jgi:nitrate/nitrite transporter NarK
MLTRFGGRKFVLSVLGLVTVMCLSLGGADAASYGAVAVIVGAFSGANGYIEGRHARQTGDSP